MLKARWFWPAAGGLVILAAALLILPALQPHQFTGTLLETPQPAFDFNLPSTLDRTLALHELRGKWVFIFFGYTWCPDICPATLGNLTQVLQSLGNQAEKVQVVFVTVDPKRDTLPRLKKFIQNFDPQHMVALSGSEMQTAEAASRYGIFYEAHTPDADGNYMVDHTATLLLLDDRGYLRETFPVGTSAADIAADLKALLGR